MLFSDATRAQQGDGFEEQKRNENLIWEQLQRFLSFESRIKCVVDRQIRTQRETKKICFSFRFVSFFFLGCRE